MPAILKWLDMHLPTLDETGTMVEMPEMTTSKEDTPMVNLLMKIADKFVPERRISESMDATAGGNAPQVYIVNSTNGQINRGTKKSRDHSIELTQTKRALYEQKALTGAGAPQGSSGVHPVSVGSQDT